MFQNHIIMQELLDNASEKMTETVTFLKKELTTIGTGTANPSLLDNIKVESYGSFIPINQLANMSAPDASTIMVQVWDKEMVKFVEKAISNSSLGLNPMSDGTLIRISVPKLSEERRVELSKLAKKYGENKKVQVRNIRRDLIDKLKKNTESKDDIHSFSDRLQKITDSFISKMDDLVDKKERDLIRI
jgi:ribosome recycling factor